MMSVCAAGIRPHTHTDYFWKRSSSWKLITINYFPAFLVNYTKEPAGRQRVLTYSLFRFYPAWQKSIRISHNSSQIRFPARRPEDSFEILEDYLSADDYFSPSIAADGFEPFYLYAAIVLTAGVPFGTTTPVIDSLIEDHAPEAASLPYAAGNLPLDALLVDCRNFYAALCLCLMHHTDALAALLPQFLNAYRPEYHFSFASLFVLYDFMDEYFEQHDCLHHPSFVQLTDTLVAATLNYYNTDFGTLLETEIAQNLSGTGSRFAGLKRYGSVRLPAIADTDKACHMLANLFRYAALFTSLRSHLFDFHLDEDRLITLDNWQTELHWHYVQYANVYRLRLTPFSLLYSPENCYTGSFCLIFPA